MEFKIDCKYKYLYRYDEVINKLSKNQLKLLLVLSDNIAHSLEELSNYMNTSTGSVIVTITRLKKKVDNYLKIVTVPQFGYRLDSNIFIDY